MIITDQFLLIHGLENEKQDLTTPQARETYYYKKLNYLKEHCDKHTLLIIDNFVPKMNAHRNFWRDHIL